jgi:DUF2075 family protein
VSLWVGLLLDGKLDEAGKVAKELRDKGFSMYLSRNLEALREFARSRYSEEPTKRFGLLASSKFRKLDVWGIQGARHPYWYYGEWFEAPPTEPRSCCRLELAISEFGCQGLELDLPLVCWGPDLVWDGKRWAACVGKPRLVRDPQRIRLNAYRVLLTRGRDGVAVFMPPEPASLMDSCRDALMVAGFQALE